MLTPQMIGVAAGAVIGIAVGGVCFYKKLKATRARRDVFAKLTYSDLVAFADKCKAKVSGIVKCRVACEHMEDGLYRVTQLMLDSNLCAIKTSSGDVVGRIIKCQDLDDKIKVLCQDKFPSDFDFSA